MSLDVNVWSDVSVNVQTVRASAKTISAITKANPGVASSTAHGYSNGDLVLLLVDGMRELDWMIARVSAASTDAFTLEGIDTSSFHTFSAGTAEKLTFGASAATFTDVNGSGGEAEDIPVKTIHNPQDHSVPGNFSAITYALGSLWDINDPALVALRAFSKTKTPCGIEIAFASGAKVYFAATPSVSMAPGGSAGAVVTTPVKLSLRGDVNAYAS